MPSGRTRWGRESMEFSGLQVRRGAGFQRIQRGAGLVGQAAGTLLPAASPVRQLRLDDADRGREEVVQRGRTVRLVRLTQYGETLEREVATSHRGRGPRLTFAGERGRLQIRLAVGQVLGRECQYGVAGLGESGVRHQGENLEAAAVHQPVDRAGVEPDHGPGLQRCLGEALGVQRLDRADAGDHVVPLGAGQMDVRSTADQAVRGLDVVHRQPGDTDPPGERHGGAGLELAHARLPREALERAFRGL